MRAGGVGALLMIALLIMEGQPENGGGTDFSGCLLNTFRFLQNAPLVR